MLTLSGAVVLGLVHAVRGSTHSTRNTVGEGAVARNIALHLLLVGLLGGLSGLMTSVSVRVSSERLFP